MKNYIFLNFASIIVAWTIICEAQDTPTATPDLCSLTSCDVLKPSEKFIKLCLLKNTQRIKGRCCYDMNNNTIVGSDLSFCHLRTVGNLVKEQAPLIKTLNLQGNEKLKLNDSDFEGLVNLKYLTLPTHLSCPGKHHWFNSTWKAWINETKTPDEMHCIIQTDTCHQLNYTQNYACPDNSICHNNGPGQFNCTCDPHWSGYKCLRRKERPPYAYIVIGTSGSSVILSAVYWFTQRRYVIN